MSRLSNWQQEKILGLVSNLNDYYSSPIASYFKGGNKIAELTDEELDYFLQHFSLSKLTSQDDETAFNSILDDESKWNFANCLLSSRIPVNVNGTWNGKTCFQQLLGNSFAALREFSIYSNILGLFHKGYKVKEGDHDFIRSLYLSIDHPEKLQIWCLGRFCLLLNNYPDIEKAFSHINVLFTIVSFKMKKPVGIGYHNILGIANNAFTHYRIHGDILLHAMKHYNLYEETLKRDHKNTFHYKIDDFEMYKPVQDLQFNEIVYKIFPELKVQSATAVPHVGQNL